MSPAAALASATPLSSPVEAAGRRALAVGGAAALLFLAIPLLSFVFGYLVVLIHEFGHAVAGWVFGYPSIPAFDFSYGGGVTVHEDRQIGILVLLYVGAALLAHRVRAHPRALATLAGTVGVHALFTFTPIHEAVIIFMGHGAELVLAGIFLYRAMSGSALRIPAERPLYAFCGFFLVGSDVRFALRLITSDEHRMLYEEAKGGGHWMDFSRLANDYLGTSLAVVAGLFLVLCVLPLLAAWLVHRHRGRLATGIEGFLAGS